MLCKISRTYSFQYQLDKGIINPNVNIDIKLRKSKQKNSNFSLKWPNNPKRWIFLSIPETISTKKSRTTRKTKKQDLQMMKLNPKPMKTFMEGIRTCTKIEQGDIDWINERRETETVQC